MRRWLRSLGATGDDLNGLWRNLLYGKGYRGTLGDCRYQWFGDLGYTGALEAIFVGSFRPAVNSAGGAGTRGRLCSRGNAMTNAELTDLLRETALKYGLSGFAT